MDARQVARAFGVHVSTIYRLTDRFLQNNDVVDRPRSGRPRVTSQRQDRNIVLTHMRDRFLPATTTARQTVGTHNRPVSDTTVRRRLIAVHLNCRRPYIGQRLTQLHRIARHNWAVLHRQWRNRQWQNIVFSDESRYCVDRADGRMRVWRRRGERFTDACVMERDSWGGPSVMLWGAISWGRRVQPVIFENNGRGHGRGVTAQRYIDEVLTPVVVPVFARQRQATHGTGHPGNPGTAQHHHNGLASFKSGSEPHRALVGRDSAHDQPTPCSRGDTSAAPPPATTCPGPSSGTSSSPWVGGVRRSWPAMADTPAISGHV